MDSYDYTIDPKLYRFGTKNKKKEIMDYFSSGVSVGRSDPNDPYSYESGINQNINPMINMVLKQMVEWLLKCITKYDQAEFHRRMNGYYIAEEDGKKYYGYDFIKDWRMHHKIKYGAFIRAARKGVKIININIMDQANRLIHVLEVNGWSLTPMEKQGILIIFQRLWRIINTQPTSHKTYNPATYFKKRLF